jgi:hypothetical protein
MKQVIIVGILLVIGLVLYFNYGRLKEGFEDVVGATTASATFESLGAPNTSPVSFTGWTPPSGSVPSATQSSAIPATTPGATVINPATSIAQAKDLESTLDAINSYKQLFNNSQIALLPADQTQTLAEVNSKIKEVQPKIMSSYADPASTTLTVAQLSALRDRIATAVSLVRGLPAIEGFANETLPPTATAGPANTITLLELQTLVDRIKAANLVLSNLRSSDAGLKQRSATLEKLSTDLQNIIVKITNGTMKLSDVQITPAQADAFLKEVDMTDKALPELLMQQVPASPPNAPTPPANDASSDTSAAKLQAIFKTMEDFKYTVNVKLAYDPASVQRTRVIDRIEALEKKIFTYASSDTPMPKNSVDAVKEELEVLKAVLANSTSSSHSSCDRLDTEDTRESFSSPEYPSMDQLNKAAGLEAMVQGGQYSDPMRQYKPNTPAQKNKNWWDGGYPSPDTFVRPGAPLTDEQIQNRGSASAFDERTVGGLDYRARAKDVCRQLKEEYGNSREFGCIEDQTSVGADYSWRGNIQMICNRIGDMWGSDAGDKYGCPPFNPNAKFRQS